MNELISEWVTKVFVEQPLSSPGSAKTMYIADLKEHQGLPNMTIVCDILALFYIYARALLLV